MTPPSPSTVPSVLEASGVFKTYRRGPEEVHALAGVDLDIRANQVVALVGPSGSGKTTLLNVLAGWERPDRGEIRWRGRVLDRPEDLPWSQLAIVPQSLGLIDELTVRENVELPLRLRPDRAESLAPWVERLLAGFGLTHLADRIPPETSLGEQQRTALARALVLAPRLLMADEPTGHQDVMWIRGVLRALRRAAANGITCLVATHHAALVRYADKVLAIRDGQVEAVDPLSVVAGGEEL
jgi:putative ABC transport system ATP-binding protein